MSTRRLRQLLHRNQKHLSQLTAPWVSPMRRHGLGAGIRGLFPERRYHLSEMDLGTQH